MASGTDKAVAAPPRTPVVRDSWYRELTITFADGQSAHLQLELSHTGTHVPAFVGAPAKWTRLAFHQCPSCPLPKELGFCPAAESLAATMRQFEGRISHEHVMATAVDEAGRRTSVEWPLQQVGAVLVQLAVFSSGCPVGKRFRPLLSDVRPFATRDELVSHLLRIVLLRYRTEPDDVLHQKVHTLLDPLHVVFSHLWKRLAEGTTGDAMVNAVIRLDAFTMLVPLELDAALRDLASDLGWEVGVVPGRAPAVDGDATRPGTPLPATSAPGSPPTTTATPAVPPAPPPTPSGLLSKLRDRLGAR